MIHIDSLTLKAFLKENSHIFTNAYVQKVKQPSRKELLLVLRNGGKSFRFYININAFYYHIGFLSLEDIEKRQIETPKSALMFCMLLRKYIENSKIIKINGPEHERIIELFFETINDNFKTQKLVLAIELMGKHSNIILYNYDTKIILGSIHNVGKEKSQYREIFGNLPYIYPNKKEKIDINNISFEDFFEKISTSKIPIKNFLNENFYDITNDFASKLLSTFDNFKQDCKKDVETLYNKLVDCVNLKDINPSYDDSYKTFSIFGFCNKKVLTINEMLNNYYQFYILDNKFNSLKQKIITNLNKETKKLETNILNLQIELNDTKKNHIYKQYADLLMMNIYNLQDLKNQKDLILEDYDTAEKINIPLEESLNIVENANKYYKKYNKLKKSKDFLNERLDLLNNKLNKIREITHYVNIASNLCDLEQIWETIEIKNSKDNEKKQDKNKKNKINIETIEIDGYTIFIGKNDKQNDYILSKLSKPNDFWFHIKDVPSAHIIVKNINKLEILPNRIILNVAKILKNISYGQKSSKVPIIYTMKKYVNKGTSKGLAFVTYSNEKEIIID